MWRLATILLGITACYAPSLRDCEIACATKADCAPEHVCTTAGFCAAPGEADSCRAELPLDAGVDAAPISPVGQYAVQLLNEENGCTLPNWRAGEVANVEVAITQNVDVVVAEAQGLAATFLDAWLGSHVFAGAQTGDRLVLVLAGTKQAQKNGCKWTFDASLDARLDGDTLLGDLRYVARTNQSMDCGPLIGCLTRQAFTGIRSE